MPPGPRLTCADEPPKPAAAAFDPAKSAAERVENQKAYAELMLSRERLLRDHLGRWVVIAGGKVWPRDAAGWQVLPADTIEAAVGVATAREPEAQHRFVFRLGEDGDVATELGGAEVANILGNGFMALLGGGLTFEPGGATSLKRRDGASMVISVKGPDGRPYVRPEIGPPGTVGAEGPLFVLATGCGGFGTISAEAAARAGLHMWEIPGVNHVEGALSKGDCRRARLRLRLPVASLDEVIPIAVWPR